MKVAVFGAAGFTGRAVLASLAGEHRVRALERDPQAWDAWQEIDGDWQDGEKVYGDIVDFASVDAVMEGMDAAIHLVVHPSTMPGAYGVDDEGAFLVNLKGLWNVLESARRRGLRRVVHVGSCQTVHPLGVFFTSEVRRPDGSLYAVCKRLQEEMCRQFHDAFGMRIVVLRPDYIVDSRLGIGRHREKLGAEGHPWRVGWVCRHDLAEVCRLAMESTTVDFDVLHIVGSPEADRTCNSARARQVLGLTYRGNLDRYRESA
jgi:nucleoside-diphosphate-sugar epimerase